MLASFADRDGLIWFDGHLSSWRDARLHVMTHGLHYGSSVFEGIRCYGGVPFKLDEHCARLVRSAEILGCDLRLTSADLADAVEAVLSANGMGDAYVRPVAWRGSEQMSIGAPGATMHVAIGAWDWPSYYDLDRRMRGIKLQLSRWARPAPHTAPTEAKCGGLYTICTMAKHEALAAGYDDALLLDWRGYVAEATGANIFFVIEGALHTPVPDCFLDGITRRTVIEIVREMGLVVYERTIHPDELSHATEVFLTGTAAEITPVAVIGAHTFAPSDLTRHVIDAYSALVTNASRSSESAKQ